MINQTKLQNRIEALKKRHEALESRIAALGEFADGLQLQELKREKLQLKDEIVANERRLRANADGAASPAPEREVATEENVAPSPEVSPTAIAA